MIKPLMEKIIVKQMEQTKTASGLILPDSAVKDKRGVIIAVGDGDIIDGKLVPLTVKVGDEIIWFPYAGHDITIEGEDYIIIRQSDIIGVFPSKSLIVS